ncbi:uncharacterized protein BDR25DRAFT_354278 [Lindgomyces ingoldianus]|uniref:Uncharacterized protein n=1 Tax=Lindgomyces ingoldianus TaxID=673940 RepID=A0ACB6R0D0_9PLEO|nr:uncharacterized protein BDR25DRAFT_354278 [Lindgomyces ingoldianus]KAF2471785.1 hypothetical protein BDR25DRAFT_354278 [Lindgomyces ingoldianus]
MPWTLPREPSAQPWAHDVPLLKDSSINTILYPLLRFTLPASQLAFDEDRHITLYWNLLQYRDELLFKIDTNQLVDEQAWHPEVGVDGPSVYSVVALDLARLCTSPRLSIVVCEICWILGNAKDSGNCTYSHSKKSVPWPEHSLMSSGDSEKSPPPKLVLQAFP